MHLSRITKTNRDQVMLGISCIIAVVIQPDATAPTSYVATLRPYSDDIVQIVDNDRVVACVTGQLGAFEKVLQVLYGRPRGPAITSIGQLVGRSLANLEVFRPVLIKQSADKLIGENELAKTAALVYAHVVGGGELAEETTETPAATE